MRTPTSTTGNNTAPLPGASLPAAVAMGSFTLLEVIVVMAVISLSTALAVSSFRGESAARAMENFALNLESYFARVRYRATEEGNTWEVYFDAPSRTFSACRRMTAAEYRELEENEEAPPPVLRWSYQEKFTVSSIEMGEEAEVEIIDRKLTPREIRQQEEDMANAEYIPSGIRMFFFYADGYVGGSGNRLAVSCGNLSRSFEVSPLTGRVLELPPEEAR